MPSKRSFYLHLIPAEAGQVIIQEKEKSMQERKNFNTSKVPRMTEVFPQAVIAGGIVFVSGTSGVDPATNKFSEHFEDQARQAFTNIKTILEEAGSGLDKIVKTTIFMVTGNDFSIVNKIYAEFFPADAPARSTPQVMPFPAGILISVECIALV
jgi:2-iminobutanoate/2-iminopropanoate deaminase